MTCKAMFQFYHGYCQTLPELLTDITKKVIDAGEYVPDGYFNFKRIVKNAELGERIVVYRLYCVGLNFKKMNVIEQSKIKE